MNRISRYLFSNFISTFASLFSTLFIIMSIVFFIQIARITSFIEVGAIELLQLYLFMLPKILIFTTPIAFFVGLSISLFKLSKENETIVLFTLSYPSKNIAKFFMNVAVTASAIFLIISIFVVPIAENLKDNFINYKKTKFALMIKPSEFGQKFGDWLVFIDSQTKDIYNNITMYYPKQEHSDEKIIFAKSAKINNENSGFSLKLNNGKAYTFLNDKWEITEFQDMIIRTMPEVESQEIISPIKYWKEIFTNDKRKKDFTIYTLVSLFPMATVYYALSFGIVTYRYEKGFIYVGTFLTLFFYFSIIMLFSKYPFITIPVVFLLFLISSSVYFKKKILSRY